MIDNKLVLAYIGNGKSTNRYHLPFSLKEPNKFIVKTIYNRQINHDIWQQIPGVIYTENLDDVLNDSQIDLVVVCLPHHLHYEFSKKVLNANKHLLCEKPFMDTYEQAKEIFDLAKSKGLFASAYQNRRYDSDFLTTQKIIESGLIGDLLELEMHFDYFRPEVPESVKTYDFAHSYVYGHACHTLDQVISYFGKPDKVHYDVKQILGPGRMNDYFDIDLFYNGVKVSVKSSYFRIKERPSFIAYGKKGMFVKEKKDLQEAHLKLFYMPDKHDDFGKDKLENFGTLTYVDSDGIYHEEKYPSVNGDYSQVYRDIYETIVNGQSQVITPEQTLLQMKMLEEAVKGLE